MKTSEHTGLRDSYPIDCVLIEEELVRKL